MYWLGGKKWTCDFSHPVVGEKCKVQIKKHKIILKAKKKDSGVWKDLMVGTCIKDTKRKFFLPKTCLPNPSFFSFEKWFNPYQYHWSILINHYKYYREQNESTLHERYDDLECHTNVLNKTVVIYNYRIKQFYIQMELFWVLKMHWCLFINFNTKCL